MKGLVGHKIMFFLFLLGRWLLDRETGNNNKKRANNNTNEQFTSRRMGIPWDCIAVGVVKPLGDRLASI